MLWYGGDWLKDPHLSMCSPATRGIWMDALCLMHENEESGSITGTTEGLSRACRCTPDELTFALKELELSGVCPPIVREKSADRHETVTIKNRRMVRESIERKSARERKIRERDRKRDDRSRDCHEIVTPPLSSSSSSSEQEGTPNGVPSGLLVGEDGSKINWQAIIIRWNDLAKANGLSKIFSMNAKRRGHYRARLREAPGLWKILECEIPLLGEFARASRWFSFPWIISSQDRLDKLNEGNYRVESGPSPEQKIKDDYNRSLGRKVGGDS
jgi:hypothetical protein